MASPPMNFAEYNVDDVANDHRLTDAELVCLETQEEMSKLKVAMMQQMHAVEAGLHKHIEELKDDVIDEVVDEIKGGVKRYVKREVSYEVAGKMKQGLVLGISTFVVLGVGMAIGMFVDGGLFGSFKG